MAKRPVTKIGGRSRTLISDYKVATWEGLNTYIKDLTELSDGQSPDSLNWLTGKYKDHIELRRGSKLLGQTRDSSAGGRVSGLAMATRQDGTQIPFFSTGQKIKYYDITTDDTYEVGSNVLPVAANNEDVSLFSYQNLAGSFMYATSPNSSIYKIHTANPASPIDLKSTAVRGIAKVGNNRMFIWQRNDAANQKTPYQLLIGTADKQTLSQYTQTTAEQVGTGDGSQKTFVSTLAFKAANSRASAFNTEFGAPVATGIVITGISVATQAVVTVASHSFVVGDPVIIVGAGGMTQINGLIGFVQSTTSTTITININSSSFSAWTSGGSIYKAEYFTDNNNGGLSSQLGGTGTINYATGAFSLTFNTAPLNTQKIYSQYYVEDSTSGGIADFTIGTGTDGKAYYFSQGDGGGVLNAVMSFDQVEYCFHALKTWYLTLGSGTASSAVNLPYRSQLGVPYFRGAFAADEGVIFIDTSNPAQPKVKILEIDANASTAVVTVVPNPLSETLDLSSYGFTKAVMWRWDDCDILACQGSLNGVVQEQNTVFFVRNIWSKQWDRLDYPASTLAAWNGMLLAGDSLSNNVFVLFSGTDDDGATINNYWTSKQFNLGVEGLKCTHRFKMRGLIQQTQNVDVYASYDSGAYVKIATVIGNASYVNKGTPVSVGSSTIGQNVVGGGGDVITAYPFEIDFNIASDRYEYIQLKFVANNIGYVQIDSFEFKDNRYKGKKILPGNTQ